MMQSDVVVFDIGGSVIAPEKPDIQYLKKLETFLRNWLDRDTNRKAVIITGGGAAARVWQNAARELKPETESESLDWIGIMATRLNAELVRTLLKDYCPNPVVTNPASDFSFTGRVLIAAGWKPGFSTDYDAVVLAKRFQAKHILMLSNISRIYDKDPLLHTDAKPLTHLSWEEYESISTGEWIPGASVPFDPVATQEAKKSDLVLIAAAGGDFENLQAILDGRPFTGTTIGPENSR